MAVSMIDLLFVLVLAYGIIRGLFKGFIVEAATFVGLITGLIAARKYSVLLAGYFPDYWELSSQFSILIVFVLIVVLTAVIFYLVAKIIKKIAKIILLGWLDKLLGIIFGFCKYLIILSLVVNAYCWLNDRFHFVEEETPRNSRLFEPVKLIIPTIVPWVDFEQLKLINSQYLSQSEPSNLADYRIVFRSE